MRFSYRSAVLLVCLQFAACSGEPAPAPDAAADAGVRSDADVDAGAEDAGPERDATVDGASDDAGAVADAALDDAGAAADAALDDSSVADAGAADAEVADAGAALDAALDDAGSTDASAGDGGLLSDVVVTHPAAPPIAPATECTVTTAAQLACSGEHVPTCSALEPATMPPACGPHFGSWAAFSVYDAAVPWGYLLHAMEHGAVVLAYACDAASCPEVPAALRDFVDTYTPDPRCSSSSARARLIVVPDPTLDVPIAIAAWGHIYRATCFDLASLRAFVDAHYAGAPEDFCSDGIDLSSTGWCAVDGGV